MSELPPEKASSDCGPESIKEYTCPACGAVLERCELCRDTFGDDDFVHGCERCGQLGK